MRFTCSFFFFIIVKTINISRLLKKKRIIIHANLAFSLLMAQLIFVTGINADNKVMSQIRPSLPCLLYLAAFLG